MEETNNGFGQRLAVLRLSQQAGNTMLDCVGQASHSSGNHGAIVP
jgi:hypothetical protein